jgi:hypothetical protein
LVLIWEPTIVADGLISAELLDLSCSVPSAVIKVPAHRLAPFIAVSKIGTAP